MKVQLRAFLPFLLLSVGLSPIARAQAPFSFTPHVSDSKASVTTSVQTGSYLWPSASCVWIAPDAIQQHVELQSGNEHQPLGSNATLGYFDATLPIVTSGIRLLGPYTMYAYGERMTLATNSGYVDTVHVKFATMAGDSVWFALIADTLFPYPSKPGAFHLINSWPTTKVYAAQWIPVPQTTGEFTMNWALPHIAVPKNFFVLVQAHVNSQLGQITSVFDIVGSRKQVAPRTPSGTRSAFLAYVNGNPTTSLFDSTFLDGQGQPVYADFDMSVVGPASQVQPAILAFASSPLNFGTVGVGSTVTLTGVLKNTGEENATISGANISGANASDFTVDPLPSSEVIGTGDTLGFQVSYSPSTAGSATATLELTLSDNSTKTVTLLGTGTGSSPSLSLSKSSHDFGNVALGASPSSGINLTNNSSSAVTVNSITVTPAGTDFTVPTPVTPHEIKAGGNTYVSVRFAPTSLGLQSATATLAMDDGSTLQIALAGTGVASGGIAPTGPDNQAIVVYPNPASNSLRIDGASEGATVELLDVLGRSVLRAKITKGEPIDVTPLLPGRYEAIAHSGGSVWTAPVMIHR